MSADASEPAENGNEDGGSATKRRRRSEDKDVGEAAADGINQGQVNGVVPVNGHAATDANGSVAPEAAFWSALEDAKDEVRTHLSLLTIVLLYAWSCVLRVHLDVVRAFADLKRGCLVVEEVVVSQNSRGRQCKSWCPARQEALLLTCVHLAVYVMHCIYLEPLSPQAVMVYMGFFGVQQVTNDDPLSGSCTSLPDGAGTLKGEDAELTEEQIAKNKEAEEAFKVQASCFPYYMC